MFQQLISDNITLLVAIFFLLVGFAMGRTSSGRPVRAEVAPKKQKTKKVKKPRGEKTDPQPHHDSEGGYFDDALIDPEDP